MNGLGEAQAEKARQCITSSNIKGFLSITDNHFSWREVYVLMGVYNVGHHFDHDLIFEKDLSSKRGR